MDINELRSAVTVFSLMVFIVLVARTWSRRNQSNFDEAAQLPFADEGPIQRTKGGAQ